MEEKNELVFSMQVRKIYLESSNWTILGDMLQVVFNDLYDQGVLNKELIAADVIMETEDVEQLTTIFRFKNQENTAYQCKKWKNNLKNILEKQNGR